MSGKLERIFLLLGALGWGASLLFVVLPQDMALGILAAYGLELPDVDPLLVYWLRMAGGGFSMIAVLFAVSFLKPHKYAVLIPLLAYLSVGEAVVLTVSAVSLELQALPWMIDAAFSAIVGIGLLCTYRAAADERAAQLRA